MLYIRSSSTPSGSINNSKVQFEVGQPAFVASTSIDLFRGPILSADLSTRFGDYNLGGEVQYDVSKGAIEKYTIGAAFFRPREKVVLQAHTGFSQFSLGYFQKFNDQVEIAYKGTMRGLSALCTQSSLGAKYYLVGGGFFKVKYDTDNRLGLAYSTDLRPGLQVTLGASVDTTKLNENAHKFGLEFNYAA